MDFGAIGRMTVRAMQAVGLIGDEVMIYGPQAGDDEEEQIREGEEPEEQIEMEEEENEEQGGEGDDVNAEEIRRQERERIVAEQAVRERVRRDDEYTYKVEKRKIEDFNGKNESWNSWKLKTRAIFRGSNLGNILTDRDYATAHPNKNRVVYSQLLGAVADGDARHYVEDYDADKDGHAAWQALVEYFEQTNIQAPLAEELKQALCSLKLHSNTTASAYVNQFKTKKLALDRIPVEHMSDYEYRNTLVKGIVDPDYNHIKQDLRNALGKNTMTFEEMVAALLDRERQLAADRKYTSHYKKQPRKINPVSDESEEDDADSMRKKICKLQSEIDRMKQGSTTDPDPIEMEVNAKGRIQIDSKVWPGLHRKARDFVIRYNRAAQFDSTPPSVPSFITLMKGRERVRRTCACPTLNSTKKSNDDQTPTKMTNSTDTSSSSDEQQSEATAETGDTENIAEAFVVQDDVKPKSVTFGIGRKYRLPTKHSTASDIHQVTEAINEQGDLLIFDTGGGKTPTISSRAWHVIAHTGVSSAFQGYGPGTPVTRCEVVHAVTKAHVKGRTDPIMLVIHHASLVTDQEETESLLTLMDLLKNSVEVNGVTPPEYVKTGNKEKTCGITVQQNYLPFEYDKEKLFFRISKPTPEEVEDSTFQTFELNSRDPGIMGTEPRYPVPTRQTQKTYEWEQIPLAEWEKRLGYAPAEVINRTLSATTQHYLEVEAENHIDPRRHFAKRFKGLQYDRRNEIDATDTIFPSVPSSQGHTCSQFFVGVNSKMWFVAPMKKERHNHLALQDHIRRNGTLRILLSDNARSETGAEWTQLCRDYKIEQRSSEPFHPNQNPAEPEIGRFSRMVRRNMKAFEAPLGLHNWCQIYCSQINNATSRRSLNWRTPKEVAEGHTPDISAFRFHFYEPVWYFRPTVKSPEDNMAKACYLCIADSSGDALTYYIVTEPHAGRPQVLIRSVIKSRRKKIGTDMEHTNNLPEYESFFFSADEGRRIVDETEWSEDGSIIDPGETGPLVSDTKTQGENGTVSEPDPNERLPADTNAGNNLDEEIEGDMMEERMDESTFTCKKIVDHIFRDMSLVFKVRYRTPMDDQLIMEIPWEILKQDEPVKAAKYIRLYVKENSRRGKLKSWADKILQREKAVTKRLRKLLKKMVPNKTGHGKTNKKKSRNTRWLEKKHKEMFGYLIPNTVEEALAFDKVNGNDYWQKAIEKEMKGLFDLDVFRFVSGTQTFNKAEGWQKAPLRMIFTVKAEMEDGHNQHKARFVVGGHRLDSSGYNVYSSTVKSLTVRLLLVIAAHLGLSTMTADVANAFCTAPNQEKAWAECGPEFGERSGQRVIIQRALYGMATASRSFHDFLADALTDIGFVPSRADPDLWIIRSAEHDTYDYIATWVDDLICVAKKPEKYMHMIEQQFKLRNMEYNPKYYLGMDLKRRPDRLLHASAGTYIKEAIRKHEKKNGTLAKYNSPMSVEAHPELDDSELLEEDDHRLYQQILGVCQWVVQVGRFDVAYAVSSLSRFGTQPRRNHLEMAKRVMGYLKKYPSKGFVVNPKKPEYNNNDYVKETFTEDFGTQYQYFQESIDPRFPTARVKDLTITFFADSDHGHDKKTRRSITGLLGFIGSTPVTARSTRQSCVQTSTFGAELTALKTATEEVIEVRYYLRSMGIEVSKPTWVFVDNEGVVLNVTNPSSSLNKKALALAYHFVREHQHGGTIQVRKIGTDDNYSDPLTKALTSNKHHRFFYELMVN